MDAATNAAACGPSRPPALAFPRVCGYVGPRRLVQRPRFPALQVNPRSIYRPVFEYTQTSLLDFDLVNFDSRPPVGRFVHNGGHTTNAPVSIPGMRWYSPVLSF